jgi:hypothetical protein
MRGLVSAMVLSPLYRTKFRVFTGKADRLDTLSGPSYTGSPH